MYANPLGRHHIDYLEAASKLGDKLIVIVNNDEQVLLKGSYVFQDQDERLAIIGSLRCVTHSFLSIDKDKSVVKSLKFLFDSFFDADFVFANGGDRKLGSSNSAEEEFCRSNGIELAYNIGGEKTGSSSETLQNFLNRNWIHANKILVSNSRT
jgi:D-beta-D-heptose 7-phosphate kinase/D-beta-D-heptose 1-phosphate adenosyltransferase